MHCIWRSVYAKARIKMIVFRLDKLLKARGWSDYRLSQESGLHPNVIGKYRKNMVKQPDLKVLNTMCAVLECTTGELMEYVPDRKAKKP
ncbi:MAG: helix-turn-helix domain-containing protein [Pyrinomonadaceae bacterium]